MVYSEHSMDTEPGTVQIVDSAATSSNGLADSIRITRQGKLRVWVKKALEFFESHPEKPLVLYSAPADVSNSTIPRLLSVVEIIKREYLKGLDVSAGNLCGLHQYNQLLCEEPGRIPTEEGEGRRNALALALEGDSHAKRSFAPYMKITLSTKGIEERHETRETYQAPAMRRVSKAAKARMRRRRMRNQG